jgi:N-acetyl sugar amidotransferase
MRYCLRCIYPENHPLGLVLDRQGVCSGCRIHEEKDCLDWKLRREKLRILLNSYKSSPGQGGYDCIIPVSGARDSYFIFHTIKHVFGMNPLLVTYNKHYNTSVGIRNLAYLRTLIGGDIMIQTISPFAVKRITHETIKKMGSIYWHCLAGQTVFPVQIAVRFKIPLIIWGAHQGIDQVGMFSHLNEVEMTRRYRKDHDLMGYEAEDLMGGDSSLTLQDLHPFIYPHDKEIEKVGVRGIYLNNYIRWDTKVQHEMMIDKYAYDTLPQERTFDTCNDVDCFHYSSLHDWIKFIKWGYGKVTDHASREIRLRRMTREQGIYLVNKYSNFIPSSENLALFLEWIDIDYNQFMELIDQFRNRSIWEYNKKWTLKDSITKHQLDPGVESARLKIKESNYDFPSYSRSPSELDEKQYVLIGRGHVGY